MKTIVLTIATILTLSFAISAQNGSNPTNKLPVKITSFTATLDNHSNVELNWTTESEINLNHFVVEKSFDGTNYSDAGLIFSYGNMTDKSNYAFMDDLASCTETVVYYRLRLVNIDGKVQFSATRIIRISKTNGNQVTITTYPNPVSSALRITIPAEWQNKKVEYELLTNNGQPAVKSSLSSAGQTETIDIATLAPGLYLMHVTCGNESASQKIIKQ